LQLPQWRGYILVAAGIGYLVFDFRRGANRYPETAELYSQVTGSGHKTRRRITLLFLIGAAMVVGGSSLLVHSGTGIAESIGVPPVFVGLTMVAIGTSLPELATAITAARKGVFDLSVGNLIGANVLNLTLVTGTAASVFPLVLSRTTQTYVFPSILVILVVFFLLVRAKNSLVRWEGAILLTLYVAFMSGLAVFAR